MELAVPGTVRAMHPSEARSVFALMASLSTAESVSPGATVLVWERTGQSLGGLVAFTRPWIGAGAVHSSARCCVEALWVASYLRDTAVERELIDAAEGWPDAPHRAVVRPPLAVGA